MSGRTLSYTLAVGARGIGRKRERIMFRGFSRLISRLLDHGSKVVILSRGMQLALHACPETLQLLRELGITYHVEETTAAAEHYNQLAQTQPVGGLFHSTC